MRRLVVCFGVAALLAVGSAWAAAPFTQATLAGTWKGSWKNETFGSTGPAVFSAKAAGTKIAVSMDLGGNVFGCADPPARTASLTKGTGPNQWNAKGFSFSSKSPILGTTKVVYVHAAKSMIASGLNPACANGLQWKLTGKFSGKSFSGTVAITLPDGGHATSTISLTRS
jgi:hypothetical protein